MEEITKQQLKKLIQDVADIKDALLGTPYLKKGYIERLEDLEREMAKLTTFKLKAVSYSAGIASTITLVGGLLYKILF